jgi:hypothetical protein
MTKSELEVLDLAARFLGENTRQNLDIVEVLNSASIAIRVAVSGRLILPGTLPRTALSRERNQVRITSAPSQQRLYIIFFEGSTLASRSMSFPSSRSRSRSAASASRLSSASVRHWRGSYRLAATGGVRLRSWRDGYSSGDGAGGSQPRDDRQGRQASPVGGASRAVEGHCRCDALGEAHEGVKSPSFRRDRHDPEQRHQPNLPQRLPIARATTV